MKYYLEIFGCQMNKSDGERITALLEKNGWHPAKKEEEADLIIIVACSVRQTAVDRVHGRALKYQTLKKKKKNLKTVVTGCVLDEDKKQLGEKFDYVADINQISNLDFFPVRKNSFSAQEPNNYLNIIPKYQSKFQAYVPVMTGCDNFCSYCVVPYTRKREYSRPAEEILNEIKNLIKNGYKEIFLIGQNVNSYQGCLNDARPLPLTTLKNTGRSENVSALSEEKKFINFPELLCFINSIDGEFWIRFATSHPKDMSNELINVISKCEKICPYIHLPIQAGSDKILKAMNRKYTKKHYLNLIRKIKMKIPDAMLSTDIIVGFPKEEEKDFLETVDVFKKVSYTMAYIARYSPRKGTAAYILEDNVSWEEKARREYILTNLLKKTALKNNKKFVGRTVKILVDKKISSGYIGKTAQFTNVKIKNPHQEGTRGKRIGRLCGKFVKVKILKADSWGMEGEILSED